MQKAIVKLIFTFLAYTLMFVIGKIVFLAFNHGLYNYMGFTDFLNIIGHGFTMDMSMAGYLTVIPAILLIISLSRGTKGAIDRWLKVYFALTATIVSLIVILDAVLYGYWQFKLDSTPIFYFISSPTAAFASAEWWQFAVGPLVLVVLGLVYYWMLWFAAIRMNGEIKRYYGSTKTLPTIVMVVLTACLFIPIRGGVTVSTMNLSRAYFSPDTKLNHAAVNPMFSLMYSLTHQNDFSSQFRYMSDTKAAENFAKLQDNQPRSHADTLLTVKRPDIYIILLESFSSHLFPSLGGEPVALGLDSVARNGLLFTNFYANSFRTDRGIPSVLSAYPGQPTTSIMKFVSKTENLPSLSKTLKEKAGYDNTYYYGGDANFTNQLAYLVSAGFGNVVSDKDFPISQKLSKWGAHDDVVFARVASELTPYNPRHPKLKVIQTSSSHEPFDVPYDDKGRFNDKRAKAFAYADSCAASFIETLSKTPQWGNSLVVLVPDHYGAYPELNNTFDKHRVPLIMTGGALRKKGTVETVGSQIDIAATLLASMGIAHDEFKFSKDLLNPKSPHFAFISQPSQMGVVTAKDSMLYNLESDRLEAGNRKLLPIGKAFLQTLYDDLSKR